jgi:hypothetical protein
MGTFAETVVVDYSFFLAGQEKRNFRFTVSNKQTKVAVSR